MEFRLFYQGLLSTKASIKEKQSIRRFFHPQLKELWDHQLPQKLFNAREKTYLDGPENLDDTISIIYPNDKFRFSCIVNERLNLFAELDILYFRKNSFGSLIHNGGDIDNKLKILFDSLRRPQKLQELTNDDTPKEGENPFFCLLSDDSLISKVSVTTDELLTNSSAGEVILIIYVKIKGRNVNNWNMGFISP